MDTLDLSREEEDDHLASLSWKASGRLQRHQRSHSYPTEVDLKVGAYLYSLDLVLYQLETRLHPEAVELPMAEPSSQQQKVNEIVANLEARKLAEKNVEEAPIKKERGVSILLGKKPKYKTSAKKNESKVIPLANSELIGGGEESASMNPILVTPTLKNSVEVKEKEPEVSLDKQLRLKKETEKAKTKKEEEEKAKKRKEEEAQIAKDMGKGALNRRASIRDEMRKSQIIMNIKPEEVSEDKLAEDMGSQFQGLWDKLGMAAAFTKRIKENVVTMASRVHPQEVLER